MLSCVASQAAEVLYIRRLLPGRLGYMENALPDDEILKRLELLLLELSPRVASVQSIEGHVRILASFRKEAPSAHAFRRTTKSATRSQLTKVVDAARMLLRATNSLQQRAILHLADNGVLRADIENFVSRIEASAQYEIKGSEPAGNRGSSDKTLRAIAIEAVCALAFKEITGRNDTLSTHVNINEFGRSETICSGKYFEFVKRTFSIFDITSSPESIIRRRKNIIRSNKANFKKMEKKSSVKDAKISLPKKSKS